MARIDGVHGPEKKPTIQFMDDWSELKRALAHLRLAQEHSNHLIEVKKVDPSVAVGYTVLGRDVDDVLHYVPMLMDAYSECFELSLQLTQAVEAQRASQDTLYVPDAQELVSGLANPGRTKR